MMATGKCCPGKHTKSTESFHGNSLKGIAGGGWRLPKSGLDKQIGEAVLSSKQSTSLGRGDIKLWHGKFNLADEWGGVRQDKDWDESVATGTAFTAADKKPQNQILNRSLSSTMACGREETITSSDEKGDGVWWLRSEETTRGRNERHPGHIIMETMTISIQTRTR